jgi:uncharacterized protein (TIGR02147 family)
MNTKSAKLRQFLHEELLRRIRSNARYSQRAFARDLKMSAGELSETLRGKRPLTYKTAQKISACLSLSEFERDRLFRLVAESENASETGGANEINSAHDMRFFELLCDPVTCALFCLIDVNGFRWEPRWIAKRLGVPLLAVNVSIQKLTEHGVITKAGKTFNVDLSVLSSPQDIPSVAVRGLHRHYLDLAKAALDMQTVSTRHINGISLAISKMDLESAKKDVANFIDHFENKYAKSKKVREAVYHLEVALFRLDKDD